MSVSTTNEGKKRIVVVGGGFAGLNFAYQLFKNKFYHVTVVDKNNYNYFTPLLYQVATSFLEPSSISYPFRKLFRNKHIDFRMGEVQRVDPSAQTIHFTDGGQLPYDQLVFATGTNTNFYGMENIRQNAISIKGIDDALIMRNSIMKTMELATLATDPEEQRKLLTIVVAGGGPTGVEVAGMLAEMKNYILKKDYPELKNARGKIFIVEGSHALLAPMSEKTHQETYDALVGLGVEVKLNTRVADYSNDEVKFSTGEIIKAKTLIWSAGVTGLSIDGIPASSLGPGKRMLTDQFNKVQGLHNIWAIGDISIQYADPLYPNGHPQLAQPAIQQGRALAKNFLAMAKGRKPKPFKYFDRGEMAIVGRHHAVVDLFKHKVHVKGFPALFVWLFIHLISLANIHNKVRTFYSWAVAYLTRDQAFRMIFRTNTED